MLNYSHWKSLFIKSNLTLAQLAKMDGAPSIASLKNRSRSEGWVAQRETHRLAQSLKTHEVESVSREAEKALVLIDAQVRRVTEIMENLAKIDRVADQMLYKPIQKFSQLDLEQLSPRDVVAFTRLGWQIKSALLEIEAARIDWDSQKVKESIG